MDRAGRWSILAAAAVAVLLLARGNGRAGETDWAFVTTDGLPIHAKPSLESSGQGRLGYGERVTVKIEMLGAGGDGPWCGIVRQGEERMAGFVQCGHLLRDPGRDEEWAFFGSTSSSPPAAATSSVIIRGNQVLLPVELRDGWNREEILLLLDTGATRTVIHSEIAARLRIDTGSARKGMARIADGSLVPTRFARIDHLRVGPHLMEDMEVSIMDHNGPAGYDGLLGMDVLRGLHYQIDFEKQQIVWQ